MLRRKGDVKIVSSAFLACDARDKNLNWRTAGNLTNPHAVCLAVVLDVNGLLKAPAATSRIPRLRVVILQGGWRRAAQTQQSLNVAAKLHEPLIGQLELSNHPSVLEKQSKLLLAHVTSKSVFGVDANIH